MEFCDKMTKLSQLWHHSFISNFLAPSIFGGNLDQADGGIPIEKSVFFHERVFRQKFRWSGQSYTLTFGAL